VPNLARPSDIGASAGITASAGIAETEAGGTVLDEFSAVLGDLSERQSELLTFLRGLRAPRPEATPSALPDGRTAEPTVTKRPRSTASRLRFVHPPAPSGARKPRRSYDYFGDLDARIDRLAKPE
jgi:hypothetical protein